MAAGWQGRWKCFELVWLLGLGLSLMAMSAVAGTEAFVVEAERVKLSRAPDPDVLDPAAIMLFKGDPLRPWLGTGGSGGLPDRGPRG
jgi:hypothetical protein